MTKDCERGSNDLETQGLNQWAIDFMVTSWLLIMGLKHLFIEILETDTVLFST